jgi:protein arginine N-methyltransferase 5
MEQAGLMHGFAGYFESRLYKDVMISINPATHSPGMFSWFPIYFPIQTPIYVAAGGTVEVQIWRKTDGKKVWYEWCTTKPLVSPIHNAGGKSYFIGL